MSLPKFRVDLAISPAPAASRREIKSELRSNKTRDLSIVLFVRRIPRRAEPN